MTEPEAGTNILYGLPHSLYTGPARAFLRKRGVPFLERSPQDPSFAGRVLPVIGRSIIPVLVTSDGRVVQDSVDIIDAFEDGNPATSPYPAGARQRLVALLFQLYGSQGLLRHAMHFRWSHYDRQRAFLDHAFGAGSDAEKIMQRMQNYLPALGVNAATAPAIEQSYDELLALLDVHFAASPYLLGGRASVGDYGLFGPLFAHLGRDPVPADRMKRQAPAVARWVERMTAPDADVPDFPGWKAVFLSDDSVPDALLPLVAHIGVEMATELGDQIGFLARWVAERNPVDGDPVSKVAHRRMLGTVVSSYRGIPVEVAVPPYLLYLVSRVRTALLALNAADRAWADELLGGAGLLEPLTRPLGFGVARRNNVEVWSLTD